MLLDAVWCGDCLDLLPVVVPDKSVDLILTDLPYGTTRCKWDSVLDLEALWVQYERVIKDRGAILLFAQTPFDKVLGASNLKMLRYEWVWEKTSATGHLNANRMPMKAHENVLVFYKKLPTYNPQKTQGHKPMNSFTRYVDTQNKSELYGRTTREISGGGATDRFPRSVLTFPSDKQTCNLHPTQKPLSLMEYFVRTYTNPGGVVLDSTCGSGTSGRAAKNLGRRYIMIEKEQKYAAVTEERLRPSVGV